MKANAETPPLAVWGIVVIICVAVSIAVTALLMFLDDPLSYLADIESARLLFG